MWDHALCSVPLSPLLVEELMVARDWLFQVDRLKHPQSLSRKG